MLYKTYNKKDKQTWQGRRKDILTVRKSFKIPQIRKKKQNQEKHKFCSVFMGYFSKKLNMCVL